jgi:hypothetical protein
MEQLETVEADGTTVEGVVEALGTEFKADTPGVSVDVVETRVGLSASPREDAPSEPRCRAPLKGEPIPKMMRSSLLPTWVKHYQDWAHAAKQGALNHVGTRPDIRTNGRCVRTATHLTCRG